MAVSKLSQIRVAITFDVLTVTGTSRKTTYYGNSVTSSTLVTDTTTHNSAGKGPLLMNKAIAIVIQTITTLNLVYTSE